MRLTIDEICKLIKMVDTSSICHFELKKDENHLILDKYSPKGLDVSSDNINVIKGDISNTKNFVVRNNNLEKKSEVAVDDKVISINDDDENLQHISSPVVGTFYKAPSPSAQNFVDIGDVVKRDTVVCIVEAMKLMNEIKAEIEGSIVEILVENGQLVEYGQPLFLVQKH